MHIVLIDNYDSFTYNLVHLIEPLVDELEVCRNDAVDWARFDAADALVFSPGPGLPSEAGRMMEVIRRYRGVKPMLGVCLGCQAMAEVSGASLLNLAEVYHGVSTPLVVQQPSVLFENWAPESEVGRYHSWAVDERTLPSQWQISARDAAGTIMALEDVEAGLYGVQFHPESIMTPAGRLLVQNWLKSPRPRRR